MSPASSVNVVSPARSTAPGALCHLFHRALTAIAPSNAKSADEMPCHLGELAAAPMFGLPDRARRHGDERRSGKTVPAQQRVHARVCCLWKGKGEIGRAFRQVQHRTDAEVTIDRVNIEIRYRNMVCVGKPAALARALPRMFARCGGKGTRCRSPHACPRPVESDAHRRAGRQHEHGGAELAMQVDDEIIAVGTQPRRKPRVIDERRQRPGSRPIVAGEFDDVGDGRIVPQQLGDCRRNQPVDLRRRITLPQFVEYRHGLRDVADGR